MERPQIVQPRSKARILRRRLSYLQGKEDKSGFDEGEIASLEAAILLLEWAWQEQHGEDDLTVEVPK
jgi:hypothetical protein